MLDDVELRPVIWLGDTKKQLKKMPKAVQKDMGDALFLVQIGMTPPQAKPFKGVGSGVFEIKDNYDKETYRVVYAIQIGNSVYILHAFHKKSKRGIATPKQDVELIKRRYQQAVEMEKQQ